MAGMARCYRLLQFLALGLWALDATVGDNGVKNGISDICIDCLQRVILSPEVMCVPHPDPEISDQCGVFKMTEGFYTDCFAYMKREPGNITEDWYTWKKCYEDIDCSRRCVRAYHNFYTSICQISYSLKKTKNSEGKIEPLTCGDYGQMHGMGPYSCGLPKSVATEMINNMTLMCGCQTVHGNRSKCLPDKPAAQMDGISHSTYTATTVGIVCGAAVVIISLIVALYWSQRRYRRIAARTDGESPQSLVNHKITDDCTGKSGSADLDYINSPSIEDNQKLEASRYITRTQLMNEMNAEYAGSPAAPSIPEYDSAMPVENSSSKARAPVPLPRD